MTDFDSNYFTTPKEEKELWQRGYEKFIKEQGRWYNRLRYWLKAKLNRTKPYDFAFLNNCEDSVLISPADVERVKAARGQM